ncbi:cytochrome P450 [Jimgerdemannia flammicorona]|uniref:Cytochrome P450 n=2 Tax=Jimgerdemannia flammicorona TaxID=994334 RepID=A0A433D6W9_9FUNG|nr:cytochrome P450 [Jimgerdemannia flammicorona]RUS33121.1 cytochrome P450 [Jimgerdemannia flammicorona]
MLTIQPSSPSKTYLLVASGILAVLAIRRLAEASRRAKIDAALPPSPPGLPIIGNIHQLSGNPPEIVFTEMSKELGPIFTLKMGVQRWIVLNSIEVVKDLIVERGTIYSSRSLSDVSIALARGDQGAQIPFMTYGEEWKEIRRIAHSALTKTKINNYQRTINVRTNAMLKSLYEASRSSPDSAVNPAEIFDFYTVSTIFAIIYGVDIEPNDERIKKCNQVGHDVLMLITPSEQLAEFLPVLKILRRETLRRAIQVRDNLERFWGEQVFGLKKRLQEGTTIESVMGQIMTSRGSEHLSDLQLTHIGSVLSFAGSEAMSITMRWLCAVLAHYPEVQEKAFAEIEHVVGHNRLPNESDEERLQYVQCIILEILRYRAAAPVSIPHATSKDDTYRGYTIPKGTTIVINIHAIHHDPKRYPNPEVFSPERHMDYVLTTNKSTPEFSERPHLAFSTGRRVCVGMNVAERVLFIGIVRFLACFRVEFATDARGERVPVEIVKYKVGNGATCIPLQYKVKIVPRHGGVAGLVGSEL